MPTPDSCLPRETLPVPSTVTHNKAQQSPRAQPRYRKETSRNANNTADNLLNYVRRIPCLAEDVVG